nr:hypothetical protein OH826_22515 [Streptomyces sp. NBC_00899]
MWIEAIREHIRPEKLPVISDSGAVTTRLSALITAALAAPTPELLEAVFEMALELSPGSEGLERARPLVVKAAEFWNADAGGRRHDT